MTAHELYCDLEKFGQKNANPAIVEKYSRYFKDGYNGFGLNHEQVKGKVDEILALPGISQEFILESSLLLVKSPKYEMTAISIQLLLGFRKSWTVSAFKTVEQWFSIGITNWAHTDYICGELMNLFFKKELVDLHSIRHWRTATNKFQRRAAVVSLIKPMKLSTDFTPFYDFIEPMMHDPEREVHQGLGWFLRETWKKQPESAEAFLMKFNDTAPRLIFQYATEKMTAEGKERFRRSKRGIG
ncbi:MAG: DNA alkylation repair protein [Bacteroidales bacterium]|nr:DNA alkylation repair protein [Bacteroidales bacterium]